MSRGDDSRIDPADYSALSNFLRGYLHEDSALEYESPRGADQAFRKDADERETSIVRSELDHLLQVTSAVPELQLMRILADQLGCRRHFRSRKVISA